MSIEFYQDPAILNLRVRAGDDLVFRLTFGQSLVGFTFESQIETTTPTIPTIANIDLSAGILEFRLTSLQTSPLSKTTTPWWFRWTDTLGKKRRIFEGSITVV